MLNLMYLFFICLLISSLIGILSYLLSEKQPTREKTSTYECGFNPIFNSCNPFSIKFFIIAILFLVFDLEIILLFPWSFTFKELIEYSYVSISIFLIFLIIGLVFEWIRGGLEWE